MREQIVVGKEYNIISRKVLNATKCVVSEVFEDYFEVTLLFPADYDEEESVELFAMTGKGQLYFETLVKEVNQDKLLIWFPISFKYLQRREFSRVSYDKEIVVADMQAQVIDISAGGLKLKMNEQLRLLEKYLVRFEVENSIINCMYEPIRMEVRGNRFIISGRFVDMNNYDRITLVQYCFGKQIENSNKQSCKQLKNIVKYIYVG